MLQEIRANSQGTIAKIIIGLIVISFSIFGIESLLFSGNTGAVAEVNGAEISPFELQQELSVQQRQLLAMLGDNADPALLDQAVLSQRALDTLIQRKVVLQATESMDLAAADAALADIIGAMEQFQIDGQFSRDMFQSALASAGFTPALFRERLAEDVQVGQLRAGFAGSDFATQRELELAATVTAEGRDIRYISLPLVDFLSEAEVSAAEVEAYYGENDAAFLRPESVSIDYIELRLDDYIEPISEERLRDEFELVRDEFEVPTETRVSHILLEGSAADRQRRAAEVLAALESGMSFADAAAEYSDDIGSSRAGGDLGYTTGSTFPAAMEAAIGALAVDERGQVDTDAGTHILLVTDRRDGTEVTFADVAGELEAQMQRDEAAANLVRDVERLSDLVFNAISLDEPAASMDFTVQRSERITRSGGDGPLAIPALLRAAFSDEVLEQGLNSEVIEVSPERFVTLRVAERHPPEVRPLEEVRAEIEAQLREERARAAADARAAALLATLEAGASVEDAANEAGLEWQVELGARRDSARLPRAVRDRAFSLVPSEAGTPIRSIVTEAGSGSYVLELSRVTPGTLDSLAPLEQQALRQRLAGEMGGLMQQQLEAQLRESAEIEIY